MTPRLGYLCLFENPSAEAGRALIRQFVLVREADRMGYDEIWFAEHHHDPDWLSPSIVSLLGHAAGVTSHARIGSMALMPGRHDPVRLAEDVATIDLLSKGRLNLGVSRGGPFADERRHAGIDAQAQSESAGARMHEALALVRRLHAEDVVDFAGAHFKVKGMRLAIKPAQAELPVWCASTSDDGVRAAARAGWGLMAGATSTPERVLRMLAHYRAEAPEGDPRLVLARFAFTAATRDEAYASARPYAEALVQHLRALGVQERPGDTASLDAEALLALSLVGSHAEVAERITQLQARIGMHSIALIPMSAQFDAVKHCLADFIDEVRPLLPDY